VIVEGECTEAGEVTVVVDGPGVRSVLEGHVEATPRFLWTGQIPDPHPWSPERPALYSARLLLPEGDERRLRFGLRAVTSEGPAILLNSRPIYPRLALSWGWQPGRRCPNPGPAAVRAFFAGLREMGFNGVKLCLWVPPAYYFDLADEMGMLLWLELPMWLPSFTPHFQQQTPVEYERLLRAVRNHPSIILYTLGCELNRDVDASFLTDLYGRLKAMAGPVLMRDNSGSGEAYGGWLAESADFYDHHFYCELQFLRQLLAAFQPVWREQLPWLMGEFGDYDAVRDWPAILAAHGGQPPWWADPRPEVNPQGARWEMRAAGQWNRLEHTALAGRLAELTAAACRQGLLHRKLTLEAVRMRPEVSGYVLTGLSDTPISTAGLWDDLGHMRYDPETLRTSNDDVVLLLGSDRRRKWVAGGDRPAFVDRFNACGGAMMRGHLVLSSDGSHAGLAHVRWEAGLPGNHPLAAGECQVLLAPTGTRLGEVAVVEFRAPAVEAPCRLEIKAQVRAGGQVWANAWPVWIYPVDPWHNVPPFSLLDPAAVVLDLPRLAAGRCTRQGSGGRLAGDRVLVCTAWSRSVDRFVKAGGRAVLLQQKNRPPGPLPVVECPYWREACKLLEPHPAWGDFPHEEAELQFYSMVPDCALDAAGLPGAISPLLRRLDTRGLDLLEYACVVQWGQGRLVATTLRLQGGLGDEPSGITSSPAAQALLAGWIRWLSVEASERGTV
jgi:hypothetical protein